MPRLFGVPPVLIPALSAGCPTLSDALAEAMAVTGAAPEIHILRDASDPEVPPRWSVGILAGEDYMRELDLDMRVPDAAQAAMSSFLISIVEELRAERPDILGQRGHRRDREDAPRSIAGGRS